MGSVNSGMLSLASVISITADAVVVKPNPSRSAACRIKVYSLTRWEEKMLQLALELTSTLQGRPGPSQSGCTREEFREQPGQPERSLARP